MKFIKLSAIAAAVMASTAALAAEPVVVVDGDDTVAVVQDDATVTAYQAAPAQQAAPAYQYNSDAGVVRNTAGAVAGTTRTLFNTVTHPAAISAEVGSLGYGANVAWGLNETTELQAGWAGGDVGKLAGGDFDANDVNYDVETDFSNAYLGVQVRPAANWFTMGAGVIVPHNDIDVKANTDQGFIKIDGEKYNFKDASLEGSLEHRNKLAPYGTIGFRPNIDKNWGVFGELGAAYMGKADATVDIKGDITNEDGTKADPKEVARKAEAEIEDKDYAEWLPIVKLGVTYRF